MPLSRTLAVVHVNAGRLHENQQAEAAWRQREMTEMARSADKYNASCSFVIAPECARSCKINAVASVTEKRLRCADD
eukprot:SAG31_NODE_31_length_32474_cov_18.308139_13_plen_77_part_00